jgi:hypothetical protein
LVKNKSFEKYKLFFENICDQKVTKFCRKKGIRIFWGLGGGIKKQFFVSLTFYPKQNFPLKTKYGKEKKKM